jgi:hypothetical protein
MATTPTTDASSTQNVKSDAVYTLALQFQGDARYSIAEYAPDGAGGWKKTKDVQLDGDSSDAQHDTYNMSPVDAGQVALVRVKANVEAVASGLPISVTATVTSGGKTSDGVQASGTYVDKTVSLSVNIVVTGVVS